MNKTDFISIGRNLSDLELGACQG